MTDEVSGRDGRPRWPAFDLFQHPVSPNKGERGRPKVPYVPEIFESMVRAFGLGWSQERVAKAHGMSKPTMNDVYFSTPEARRARQAAADLFEMQLLDRLNRQSIEGKTSATEKLLKRLDKSRLGPAPLAPGKAKKRKGVKEERRDAAWDAGRADDEWGPLLHGESGKALPN